MVFVICASVLSVGLEDKAEQLRTLPVRIVPRRLGKEAISSFKNDEFDGVITCWDLDDMPAGGFLRAIKTARPYLPAVVITEAGDVEAEIGARSLGASAVVTTDTSGPMLRTVVSQVLRIESRIVSEPEVITERSKYRGTQRD